MADTQQAKTTVPPVVVVADAHETAKARLTDDKKRAKEVQAQFLAQLKTAMEQPEAPEGIEFGQVFDVQREQLVRQYVGKQAFPNTPEGKTTADMGDPFYGKKIDTLWCEYGDNMQQHQHNVHILGWEPVVDKTTGEHVRTTDLEAQFLYQRPIEFRKTKEMAGKARQEAQMKSPEVPGDALNQGGVGDGVAYNEVTMSRGG